jgi:response regulator RpfG family c-di-GMP phosphodiesterase
MSKSVLLVDDDPDILDSLKTVLEMELDNVAVHTAPSGKAGLAVLTLEKDVGLIISDYRMPGMDGAEFLERADSIRPGIPRVLISAFPEKVIQDRIEERIHVERILPKPMDMDELVGLTKSLLGPS